MIIFASLQRRAVASLSRAFNVTTDTSMADTRRDSPDASGSESSMAEGEARPSHKMPALLPWTVAAAADLPGELASPSPTQVVGEDGGV